MFFVTKSNGLANSQTLDVERLRLRLGHHKRIRRDREDHNPEGSSRPAKNNSSHPDHSQPPLSSSKFLDVTGASPIESSMIVGPAVAEDVQILGQYLTSQKRAPPSRTQNYNPVLNAPGSPILYLSIPKRRGTKILEKRNERFSNRLGRSRMAFLTCKISPSLKYSTLNLWAISICRWEYQRMGTLSIECDSRTSISTWGRCRQ